MAEASGSAELSQVLNTVQSQIKATLHDEFDLLRAHIQRIADHLSRLGLVCPEESFSPCPQIPRTDAPSDPEGQPHQLIEIVVRHDEVEAQSSKATLRTGRSQGRSHQRPSEERKSLDFASVVSAPLEGSSDESECSIASVMSLHSKQFDRALAAMQSQNRGRASGSSDSNLRHGRASDSGQGSASSKGGKAGANVTESSKESPRGDRSPNDRNPSRNLVGRPYAAAEMEVHAAPRLEEPQKDNTQEQTEQKKTKTSKQPQDAAPQMETLQKGNAQPTSEQKKVGPAPGMESHAAPQTGVQGAPQTEAHAAPRDASAERCSHKNGVASRDPEHERYGADEREGAQEDHALPKPVRDDRDDSSEDGNLPSHMPARLDMEFRQLQSRNDLNAAAAAAAASNPESASAALNSPKSSEDMKRKSGMTSTITLSNLLKRNANRIIHLQQDRPPQQGRVGSGQTSGSMHDIFARSAEVARVRKQVAQSCKKGYTEEEVPTSNVPFFALVTCGVVDRNNGLANRLYKKMIVFVVVAILVHEITQFMDDFAHNSFVSGRGLSRLVYAVCTLLSLSCTQASSIGFIIGPDRDMIGQYAEARGLVNEWRRRSLKWFTFAVGLCLTSVLLEGLVAHGLLDGVAEDNKSVHPLVSLEGLVLSGLHTMSLFLQLYICIALEISIDKFCADFMSEENYSNAVDGWNLIDAILVQTCSAIAVSYLVALSSVAFSFIPAGLDVYTQRVDLKSEEQLARWVIGVLTPLLLKSVLALVVLGKGASVSQKCATVPGFISSVLYNSSGEFPGSHQYLVTFVQQSGSGFYILGARLTMFVIVKLCWAFMMVSVFLAQSQLS